VYGTYRSVQETQTAIEMVYRWFHCKHKVDSVHWYLNQPVSNSGRLAQRLRDFAQAKAGQGEPLVWSVNVVKAPDVVLKRPADVVVSCDSAILDHCQHWHKTARQIYTWLRSHQSIDLPKVYNDWLIDLHIQNRSY